VFRIIPGVTVTLILTDQIRETLMVLKDPIHLIHLPRTELSLLRQDREAIQHQQGEWIVVQDFQADHITIPLQGGADRQHPPLIVADHHPEALQAAHQDRREVAAEEGNFKECNELKVYHSRLE
jgi:hypothetical protein